MLEVIQEDPTTTACSKFAVAAGSRLIMAGDSDPLRLASCANIRIVKVADFMMRSVPRCWGVFSTKRVANRVKDEKEVPRIPYFT